MWWIYEFHISCIYAFHLFPIYELCLGCFHEFHMFHSICPPLVDPFVLQMTCCLYGTHSRQLKGPCLSTQYVFLLIYNVNNVVLPFSTFPPPCHHVARLYSVHLHCIIN
jgi:hypothetical protein